MDIEYLVHYQGWKNTWDEWVPETRILMYNEKNVKTQNRLKKLHRMKQMGKSQNTYTQEGINKRRRDVKLEMEEDYLRKPEIRIELPDVLKGQLVNDWENVTKNSKLVTLPKEITVSTILNRYSHHRKDNCENSKTGDINLDKVCEGIQNYFNQLLGKSLLYRFEKLQYANIIKTYPHKELAEVYGAEHLLRLIVRMPSIVAHSIMNKESVEILTEHIADLLRFMQKQQKQLFQIEYEYSPFNHEDIFSSQENSQAKFL